MKRAIVILGILILLPHAAHAETIAMSAEMLFMKALDYAVESGAMPTEIDKIGRSFKTYPKAFAPSSDFVDCGSLSGVPAIQDRRARTGVKYTVKITPVSKRRATITFKVDIDGYLADDEGAPEFHEKHMNAYNALNCISTGGFEANLLGAMRKQEEHSF
jgi:hypothetical protein